MAKKHEYTAPEFLQNSELILEEMWRTAKTTQQKAQIKRLLEEYADRKAAEEAAIEKAATS